MKNRLSVFYLGKANRQESHWNVRIYAGEKKTERGLTLKGLLSFLFRFYTLSQKYEFY